MDDYTISVVIAIKSKEKLKFPTIDVEGLKIGRSHPPRIMGILNLSPESPYKPSIYTDLEKAVERVDCMVENGADIIDIGLSSANKKIKPLTELEELSRFEVAIKIKDEIDEGIILSVETRYSKVAEEALKEGWAMVNDICGFADPNMPIVCDKYDAAVVKMAGSGDLNRPGDLGSVEEIYLELTHELTDKTIIDPAFGGWGKQKTLDLDVETFRQLERFCELSNPVLISINRKNFLRRVVGKSTEDSLSVSLAATAIAIDKGVSVIRTHDISETYDAAMVGYVVANGTLE